MLVFQCGNRTEFDTKSTFIEQWLIALGDVSKIMIRADTSSYGEEYAQFYQRQGINYDEWVITKHHGYDIRYFGNRDAKKWLFGEIRELFPEIRSYGEISFIMFDEGKQVRRWHFSYMLNGEYEQQYVIVIDCRNDLDAVHLKLTI